MGLYQSLLLPPLLHLVMKNRDLTEIRRRIVPLAEGRVLEVGAGSGLNLPYYGSRMQELWIVEPNATLAGMAFARAKHAPFTVEFIDRTAETIPMEDRSFDTVVMTWTLCSVWDPDLAMQQVRRVLRPGGILLFAEHGLAPDARVRSVQDRLTPFWRHVSGGCHLNRKPDAVLRAAGFRIDQMGTRYIRGPRPFAFMYEGCAKA